MYSISKPHPDIYLIVRVDRLLSIDTSAEMYMKIASDLKGVAKLQKIIQQAYSKATQDRMPLLGLQGLLFVMRKFLV